MWPYDGGEPAAPEYPLLALEDMLVLVVVPLAAEPMPLWWLVLADDDCEVLFVDVKLLLLLL